MELVEEGCYEIRIHDASHHCDEEDEELHLTLFIYNYIEKEVFAPQLYNLQVSIQEYRDYHTQ